MIRIDREHLRHGLYFLAAGVINTAFSYGLYLLLQLFLHYQAAFAISFVAGVCFSYWLNSRFVFRTPMSWKGLMAYPLVYLVQYAASVVLLALLVERFGVPQAFAPLLVTIITIPLTFVMTRWLLLRGNRPAA